MISFLTRRQAKKDGAAKEYVRLVRRAAAGDSLLKEADLDRLETAARELGISDEQVEADRQAFETEAKLRKLVVDTEPLIEARNAASGEVAKHRIEAARIQSELSEKGFALGVRLSVAEGNLEHAREHERGLSAHLNKHRELFGIEPAPEPPKGVAYLLPTRLGLLNSLNEQGEELRRLAEKAVPQDATPEEEKAKRQAQKELAAFFGDDYKGNGEKHRILEDLTKLERCITDENRSRVFRISVADIANRSISFDPDSFIWNTLPGQTDEQLSELLAMLRAAYNATLAKSVVTRWG